MKGKHKAGRFYILLKHMNGILSCPDTVFIIKKTNQNQLTQGKLSPWKRMSTFEREVIK